MSLHEVKVDREIHAACMMLAYVLGAEEGNRHNTSLPEEQRGPLSGSSLGGAL